LKPGTICGRNLGKDKKKITLRRRDAEVFAEKRKRLHTEFTEGSALRSTESEKNMARDKIGNGGENGEAQDTGSAF